MNIFKDNNGNQIKITNGNIRLILSNGKVSQIGTLDKERKMLCFQRKRERHLLRKANSYGFNYDLLNRASYYTHIKLTDDYGKYIIPIKSILDNGSFLWFKQQGFERQIFYTLEQCFTYKL